MQERTLRVLEFDKILQMLADLATSPLGREKAYQLLPSGDLKEVALALRETTEAREAWSGASRLPLGGIHDVREEVATAGIGRTLAGEDLLRIAATLETVAELKEFFREHGDAYPALRQKTSSLVPFPKIQQAVKAALGPGGEVLDQASPKLHALRNQIRTLQNRIKDRLESIVRSAEHQKYLQENIVTLRNGRYVIPVKQEHKSLFPGIVHDQSSSGATLFIEPLSVMEINNQLRQVEADEEEEVRRILAQLSGLVAAASREIQSNLEILAQLDLTVAKARLSLELQGVEPVLNDKGVVRLRGARHPLLTGHVVPIDLDLGESFSTLVITGPNTGGKTVSLKTVGLLVLMAQAGMHVPARPGTELPVFTGVFSDIGDEQSIEQSLSTFSSHMTQIVSILNEAKSSNDLVLLDELGAGTDPAEGAALAVAILSVLHQRGVRTIATTHYSELKAFAYNTPGVQNASVEFDLETLKPTYRLAIGLPGQSNAFAVASRLGLSEEIIERAKAVLSPDHWRVEEMIAQIVADRKELEEDRRQAAQLRIKLEKEKNEYAAVLAQLQSERERLVRKAREEARDLVRETRREMENILRQLREAQPEQRVRLANDLRQKLNAALETLKEVPPAADQPEAAGELDFTVGSAVELTHLGKTGVIIAVDGDQAQVQLDKMRVWVERGKLRRAKCETPQRSVAYSVGVLGQKKAEFISPELDLRGLPVEDALLQADKYLDEAFLAGLAKVRLIHGKGTGALRTAVAEYLKGHPHVKGYRWGDENEGGMGVTVVELEK